MTPKQASRQIGCSVSTVKAWIRKRKLRARMITNSDGCKQYVILPQSLRAFLKRPKTELRGWKLGRKRGKGE